MDLCLTDKRAIVTGASRGIGLAVVQLLRNEGVKVVAASRSGSAELRDTGAFPVNVDLTRTDGSAYLARQASLHLGEVDFLVNCVGGPTSLSADLSDSVGRWRTTFELNLFAAMQMAAHVLPGPGRAALMRAGGAMVHIAGLAAHLPGASPIDYAAAKGALITASRHLAAVLSPYRIRSNTISPGPTATKLWESAAAANQMSVDALFAALPRTLGMSTGQMIDPIEVAALTVFLLSPYASSITGTDHEITGGLHT